MKTICIGENLVDVYKSKGREDVFPGGAPFNVACYLSSFNLDSYFVTNISLDTYGKKILDCIKKYGVKEDYIYLDKDRKSTRAEVSIDKNGDRSFSFIRDNTAEFSLSKDQVKEEMFKDTKCLHFCSIGLVPSPLKEAHIKAIKLAKENGAIISFDVNLRRNIYNDDELLKDTVFEFMKYADIVKISDDELEFLTNAKLQEQGVKDIILAYKNIDLVFITCGSNGSYVYDRNMNYEFMASEKIDAIDTTGAGDCFSACYIKYILQNGFFKEAKQYKKCLEFATKECAKICLRKGAL